MENLLEKGALLYGKATQFFSQSSSSLNNSQMMNFIAQHEEVICDVALVALDLFSLFNAPYLFTVSLAITAIGQDAVDSTCQKVCQFWNQHPMTRPIIAAGTIIVCSMNSYSVVAIASGTFSANRLREKPAAQSLWVKCRTSVTDFISPKKG